MRIYADSLKPNIPYKTILLSTRDTADFAVVEALEKYGLEKENPREYCIARVTTLVLLQTFYLTGPRRLNTPSPLQYIPKNVTFDLFSSWLNQGELVLG